jgi:hypothetical protein
VTLARVDHVAYVARDLAAGVAALGGPWGLEVATEFALPQFSLRGAFLLGGPTTVEVIAFDDARIAEQRLAGEVLRLDHIAYEVADLDEAIVRLQASGARLCAPDGSALNAPLELGGKRHAWAIPPGAPGICIQLVGWAAD